MKKIIFALALAVCSIAVYAQDDAPGKKYSVSTNSFWNNWYLQTGISWTSYYSSEEYKDGKGSHYTTNPLKSFRSTPGLSVSLGKWFTPGLGLRTKFQGVWGRSVISDSKKLNESNDWTLQEQAMFDLNNLFCGYDESHIWNLRLFAGAGIERSCTYNTYSLAASCGVNSSWKLNTSTSLYIEGGLILGESFSNGFDERYVKQKTTNRDRQFYVEVGLSFNIGKSGFEKSPDVASIDALYQAQIDALTAQIEEAQQENARLEQMLQDEKAQPDANNEDQ